MSMSLLQRTGQLTETDESHDVTSSGTVEVLARAAILTFGIAGIIISIATLVSALLR